MLISQSDLKLHLSAEELAEYNALTKQVETISNQIDEKQEQAELASEMHEAESDPKKQKVLWYARVQILELSDSFHRTRTGWINRLRDLETQVAIRGNFETAE